MLIRVLFCILPFHIKENRVVLCFLGGALSHPVTPIPMVKYKYILQVKYTETVLSNDTRKLLSFEISRMLIAV